MNDHLFTFHDYTFDPKTGTIVLSYLLDDLTFEETYVVPMEGVDFDLLDLDELDRALFNLHLMAGVGYWKTYIPSTILIESGSLTKEQVDFWNTTYTQGLGEFFYTNDLDPTDAVRFPSDPSAEAPELTGSSDEHRDALVPLGGGKDSIVTAELLKQHDIPFSLFVTKDAAPIQATGEVIDRDRLVVSRTLSPTIFELNKEPGVYNGHIPITGILSFLSIVVSVLHGKTDVIFSLEQSAEEGNVPYHGMEVNHQYSKSLAFERALQTYLSTYVTKRVRLFSLIRPYYELKIVQAFVKHTDYLPLFSSCNRNFTFAATNAGTPTFWCQDCPKCAFLFVLLSAFLPHKDVVAIIGDDLFAREDLLDLYRELLGIQGHKPFECVGEAREVAAAFELAYRRGDATETRAMQLYLGEARDRFNDPDATIAELLAPSTDHAIPEDYQSITLS